MNRTNATRLTERCGPWSLALVFTLLVTMAAVAQDGHRGFRGGRDGGRDGGRMWGGPFGTMLQPEILRRDASLITRELDLDKSQQAILETMVFDYEGAFSEAADQVRERMSELRPQREGDEERREERRAAWGEMRELRRSMREIRRQAQEDPEGAEQAMEELQQKFETLETRMRELRPQMPVGEELETLRDRSEILRDWRSRRNALRQEFMDNLQATLEEHQQPLWDDFGRTLRREKTLRDGQLSGERVDLFRVAEELELDEAERAVVDPLLVDYAIVLDQALIARNTFLETSRMDTMAAMLAGDREEALRVMDREAGLRTAVRDINDEYADLIVASLPDERAAEARTEYRDTAYPRVFRPTTMGRSFEIAAGFEDLDDEAREAIATLQAAYAVDVAPRNEELLRVLRQYQPVENRQRVERRLARMNGEPREERPEDPVRDAFEGRAELDQSFRRQLEAMLTPEQIAELPEMRSPERRGDRFGGFGGFGPPGGGDDPERRRRFMERFDTNGDGELSEEERRAIGGGRRGGGRRDGGRQ